MALITDVEQWFVTWAEGVVQDAEAAAAGDSLVSGAVGVADVGGGGLIAGTLAVVGGISLPEILLCVGAIILIIVVIALLMKPLAALLGSLPFIGNKLQDAINTASDTVISDLLNAAGAIWQSGVNFFRWLWAISFGAIYSLAHAAQQVGVWIFQTATQTLPKLGAEIVAAAEAAETGAINQAYQWASEAWTHADQLFAQAESDAKAGAQAVEAQAYQWASEAWTHGDQLFQTAETDIQNAKAEVLQTIGDDVQSVELQLGNIYTTVEHDINTAAQGAVNDAEALLLPAIGVATAVATATASQLQKYLDDCGTTMCTSNGQNAKNVKKLSSSIELGALLAFLAAAITEPIPTADVTAGTVGVISGAATSALESIVGVAA